MVKPSSYFIIDPLPVGLVTAELEDGLIPFGKSTLFPSKLADAALNGMASCSDLAPN